MILATPLSRARWALAGGLGMFVNVAIFVTLTAAGIGIGVATTGSDVGTPLVGSLVLGLYAGALAGIGHAVGGVAGTRFAATAVVVFVVVTWFVQLLGPLLGLPDLVRDLALTSHYGQPMVGSLGCGGIIASLALADRRRAGRRLGLRTARPARLTHLAMFATLACIMAYVKAPRDVRSRPGSARQP